MCDEAAGRKWKGSSERVRGDHLGGVTLRFLLLSLLVAAVGSVTPGEGHAQIPDTFTNLQYFPEDVSRDELIDRMRRFSLDLGVRCQFCHVGSVDGVSFEGVDFASDDSPRKRSARYMLGLVDRLNAEIESELPDVERARTEISCKTCHRGISQPRLLRQELAIVLDTRGASGLEEAYTRAREALEAGRYDFGEWEVNLFAEDLETEGRIEDAIAVWELNLTAHENSTSILGNLGRLYADQGRTEDAIRAFERVLEIQPQNAGAQRALEALRGGA